MKKLQIADAAATRVAIQREVARSEDSRYEHRLHGLLLLTAGLSCRQVAALFGESSTTIQRWVRRFERGGLQALREEKRSGRPHLLDAAQRRQVRVDLRMDPLHFGYAARVWSGRVLSEHLRRHYALELGIRQCQRIFRQLRPRVRRPYLPAGRR
jgi:transposase